MKFFPQELEISDLVVTPNIVDHNMNQCTGTAAKKS